MSDLPPFYVEISEDWFIETGLSLNWNFRECDFGFGLKLVFDIVVKNYCGTISLIRYVLTYKVAYKIVKNLLKHL